jgi:N-dimethylarginine dimethylaminohydrolase
MPGGTSAASDVGRLARVVVKHPREAFRDAEAIGREWRDLNFTAPPDLTSALAEYDRFLDALRTTGAELLALPAAEGTTLDSVYARDASVMAARGAILCRMGKPQRSAEPAAQGEAFRAWGIPVLGEILAPGYLEGGDVVWLDERTVAVGRGYRTNASGVNQLRTLLGDSIDQLIEVPLPHWRGPGDVFHLMSLISPVDADLAVVYSPLLPVPFREWLLDRGMTLVEVPDDEFDSMGANVLALAPRRCLALEGNPRTRERLQRAGAEVVAYSGREISVKGGGGPTCLTRPVARDRR